MCVHTRTAVKKSTGVAPRRRSLACSSPEFYGTTSGGEQGAGGSESSANKNASTTNEFTHHTSLWRFSIEDAVQYVAFQQPQDESTLASFRETSVVGRSAARGVFDRVV